MRSMVPACLALVVLAGCTTALGSAPLLARDSDLVATKLLRPGAGAESCRTTVFGVRVGSGAGSIDEAMTRLLALDAEGNVVANATVEERRLVTGVLNRRCVSVRGDLARSVSTLIVPVPGHHEHGAH